MAGSPSQSGLAIEQQPPRPGRAWRTFLPNGSIAATGTAAPGRHRPPPAAYQFRRLADGKQTRRQTARGDCRGSPFGTKSRSALLVTFPRSRGRVFWRFCRRARLRFFCGAKLPIRAAYGAASCKIAPVRAVAPRRAYELLSEPHEACAERGSTQKGRAFACSPLAQGVLGHASMRSPRSRLASLVTAAQVKVLGCASVGFSLGFPNMSCSVLLALYTDLPADQRHEFAVPSRPLDHNAI